MSKGLPGSQFGRGSFFEVLEDREDPPGEEPEEIEGRFEGETIAEGDEFLQS